MAVQSTASTIPFEQTRAFKRRWIGLVFICISLLVIAMDNTVLNNALPSIGVSLSASTADLQWIIDAYILVFASLLLTMGSTGDRLGRKRLLQIGLVLFPLMSSTAVLATNALTLTIIRACMGFAGAMILPSTLSLISGTFPRRELPQAIAIWSAIFGLGVGIGPLIGGSLLAYFDWHAVFLINVPIAIVALIGGAYYLGESKDLTAPPADLAGVVLSAGGLFALVYAIIDAGISGWGSAPVLITFGLAVVLLIGFGVWEIRTPNAMLPMRFFRSRSFSSANVILTLIAFTLQGTTFLIAQYLQTINGFKPIEAGLRVFPLALTLVVATVLSARLAARIGVRYTVAIGTALTAIGLFYSAQTYQVGSPYTTILIGFVIIAAGLGLATSPATATIIASLPREKAGVGSALNDTTRQLGSALGVAVQGTIVNGFYVAGVATLIGAGSTLPVGVQHAIGVSVQSARVALAKATLPAPIAQQAIATTNQAFMSGLARAFTVSAIILLVASGIALITLPGLVRPKQAIATPIEAAPAELSAE